MPNGTRTSPTTRPSFAFTTLAGAILELRSERIVGGEEEPALAALFEDGFRGAVGERGRVVAVMDGVGRAVLAGQRCAGRADGEERNFLFLDGRVHREADAGVGAAEQHRQAARVGPFAKFLLADVRLVLMIGGHQLDRLAENGAAEIGDRHLDRLDAAGADDVGVRARTCRR